MGHPPILKESFGIKEELRGFEDQSNRKWTEKIKVKSNSEKNFCYKLRNLNLEMTAEDRTRTYILERQASKVRRWSCSS